MKQVLNALLVCTVATALSGCVRHVVHEGTHGPVHVPGPNTEVRLNNVSLLDDSLANTIAIQGTNWQKTATGTAEVWVQVRNRTDYRYHLEGRVQFFNENQAPIGKPTAWKRVIVGPNEITTYREFSRDTNVAYYYVEIREGR